MPHNWRWKRTNLKIRKILNLKRNCCFWTRLSIGSTLFVKYCEITRTYLVNRKNPTSHTAIGHGENINIHDSTGYAKKNKFLDRFKYASSNIYSDRRLRIKPLIFFYRRKFQMLWNLLIIWLLTEIPISLKIILFVNELSISKAENDILLPKLFWSTLRKNCSSDREKLL